MSRHYDSFLKKFIDQFVECRSALVAATASVRSIAAEEENVDSASSDEDMHYINEVDDSPVCIIILKFYFT